MVGAVFAGDLDIDQWIASHDALGEGFNAAFFNSWDELTRDRTADDGVNKFKFLTIGGWLDIENHMTILTMATALFLVLAFGGCFAADGFAIRNVDFIDEAFHAVFTFHLAHDVVEMHFAHGGEL